MAASLKVTSPLMSGPEVLKVQKRLDALGFAPGPLDGVYGRGTAGAVKAFQRKHGLTADGIVGPQTRAALAADGAVGPRTRAAPAADAGAGAVGPRTPAVPAAAQLSEAGARFVARFEGFSGKLYNDPANHCTIGYGHLVHHGPINGSEPDEFCSGITEAAALALLREDAASAAAAVCAAAKVPLSQTQLDALISFTFNVGNGAFAKSTLLKLLNGGDYNSVPSQLGRWTKAGGKTLPGLVSRRTAEGELFAHGRYG
jgi:lysozyme